MLWDFFFSTLQYLSAAEATKGSVFLDQLQRIPISKHFISTFLQPARWMVLPAQGRTAQVWFHEPDHVLHRTSSV